MAQFTQERVEYNVFLFDEPLKGSKSLKIVKISLTFRFDKLSNLSKSVHTGENSQILTVSNKKNIYLNYLLIINNKHLFFNLSLNRANFEKFKKKIISKTSLLEKEFSNGNIKHHKSYAGLNAVNNYNNFDSFCP
jgi:hypothetical protein